MRSSLTPLTALLITAMFLSPCPVAAQADPGTRFIPPDAIAAVVVKPSQWWRNPLIQIMPTELISLESRNVVGLAPEEISSVLVFGGLPEPDGRPRFAIVLETAQPYDLKQILPRQQEEGVLSLHVHENSGVRYLKSNRSDFVSVYPLSETTWLSAFPDMLESLLRRMDSEPEGPLAELVRQGRREAELQVYAVAEPMREMARFLLGSPQLPEPWRQFRSVPDQLRHLELYADLSTAEGEITLLLTGRNVDGAEKLESAVGQVLELASRMTTRMAESRDAGNPQAQALAQYQARMMELLRDILEPTRQGDQVRITTAGKEQLSPHVVMAGTAALLVPALEGARTAAMRDSSTTKLKMILLAMHNYYDTHGNMPSQASRDTDGRPLLSWRVHVLPFVGQQELYQQFRLDEPWDSQHNLELAKRTPPPYVSPANPELAEQGKTRFQYLLGEGLPASSHQELQFRHITDGTSNTLAVVEAPADRAVIWTRPDDLEIDLEEPVSSLVGAGTEGFLGARYDGSVRFYQKTIRNETLKKLLTHSGGEIIARDELD